MVYSSQDEAMPSLMEGVSSLDTSETSLQVLQHFLYFVIVLWDDNASSR